jgi:hypothetical protein
MRDRGPQTRGPHEIAVVGGADFVGWEMLTRQMGRLGAEDPPEPLGRNPEVKV